MSEKLKLKKPTLVLISGLSATGKTTAALAAEKHFREMNIDVKRPITSTTRDPRPNEKEGVDYYFWGYREFLKRMKPQIESAPHEYDADNIANNWYWCRYEDTKPNIGGISILPIALSVCSEMRRKYLKRYPKIRVATLSLRISDNNLEPWIARMKKERPERKWKKEHRSQEQFCTKCQDCVHLQPDWNMETDINKFLNILNSIIFSEV